MTPLPANLTTQQLRILAHLLTSQSVTATSHAFETSQPAISRLLADMRRRFSDPLLVRTAKGMTVTDRGRAVRDEIEELLRRLSALLEPERSFDPRQAEKTFSLGFTDANMVTLVPSVVVAIKRAGPGLHTHIHSIDPEFDIIGALEQRRLDVVIDCVTDHTRHAYGHLRFAPLGREDVVLLVREGHPLVADPPRDFASYNRFKHVAPFPISNFEKGPIDGALAALGTPRRIHSFIPEYNLIPHVLTDCDLVFTTCRSFAEHYARHMPLRVLPAPDFFPKMEFRLLWHEVAHLNPAAIWLRDVIHAASRGTATSRASALPVGE